jgi:hypothetical protein
MRFDSRRVFAAAATIALFAAPAIGESRATTHNRQMAPAAYLGFDTNDYPGDAALPVLRAGTELYLRVAKNSSPAQRPLRAVK